jgi:hypothetical protein
MGLRTVADARYFGYSAFSAHRAELRRFAAKIFQTVEDDREISSPSVPDKFNAASINFV